MLRGIQLKAEIFRKTLNIALYLLIYTLRFHPVKHRQIAVKQNLLATNDLNHLSDARPIQRIQGDMLNVFHHQLLWRTSKKHQNYTLVH